MVWTKVKKIIKIQTSNDYYVEFEYFERGNERAVVTQAVLDYLHIDKIDVDDEIFVNKIFPNNEPVYIIRKVEKDNGK